MQLTIFVDDVNDKLFNDPDKTLLVHILLNFKRIAPFLAAFLFIGNIAYLVVFVFWSLLLYNTQTGKKLLFFCWNLITQYIELAITLIRPVANLEDKLFRGSPVLKKSSLIGRLSMQSNLSARSVPSNDSSISDEALEESEPVNSNPDSASIASSSQAISSSADPKQKVIRQKMFVVYENQRWWLTRGWCTKMLSGDRSPWSDDLGKMQLSREAFRLPGPNWQWEAEWNYVVDETTDKDGWDFANKFKAFKKPKREPTLLNVVRRRKWVRRCIEV